MRYVIICIYSRGRAIRSQVETGDYTRCEQAYLKLPTCDWIPQDGFVNTRSEQVCN